MYLGGLVQIEDKVGTLNPSLGRRPGAFCSYLSEKEFP